MSINILYLRKMYKMPKNKKTKYIFLGIIILGFYGFIVYPYLEELKKGKTIVKGVVLDSEWYSSSLGFSSKGGRGYFKQKIKYSFIIEGKEYTRTFNNGPSIGVLSKGDSILVKFENYYPNNSEIIKKVLHKRKKIKTASNVQMQNIDRSLLNGIWGEDLEEKSLYAFQGDSITYTEGFQTYYLNIKHDTIVIDYLDWVFHGLIKKLTKDELIIENIRNNNISKMIRFK